MMELCLKVIDKAGNTTAVSRGNEEVHLMYSQQYQTGDRIVLESAKKKIYVWIQFDDALGKSLVYLTENITYVIPEPDNRMNLSPKAFYGKRHLLSAKAAANFEIAAYQNLALNVYDQHQNKYSYPHAAANVETRGEAVFAASNAIDGVTINTCHGEWPYQSWGINMQDDAAIRIEFGRSVEVDRIILYTRADFPHDNWWNNVSFSFSDQTTLDFKMTKSTEPHELIFEPRKIQWVEMHDMIKSSDPSPFPALTQIEVYGKPI